MGSINRCKTLIIVHEVYGQMHPIQLLAHDPLSSSADPTLHPSHTRQQPILLFIYTRYLVLT